MVPDIDSLPDSAVTPPPATGPLQWPAWVGSGIGPAELARIFERFATGSQAAGRRGMGLGLALVRAVTEGHGGSVAASSTPGEGSRFELILPVLTDPETASPPHADHRSSR